MHRHTNTTAHGDAVNQGGIGFGKCFDEIVERVFFAIKAGCLGVTGTPPIMQRANITTGAKALFTRPFNDNMFDRRVARPIVQHRRYIAHH